MTVSERDLIMLMRVNEDSLRFADNGLGFIYNLDTRRALAERLLNQQHKSVEAGKE